MGKANRAIVLFLFAVAGCQVGPSGVPRVLGLDGGWCWFESPRAVIAGDQLVIGSVASGWNDPNRRGDIELIVHDIPSNQTSAVELHDRLQLDDHDSPALHVRPDGRLLAMYGRHNNDNRALYRISEPGDLTRFGSTQTYIPSESTRLTYSNLIRLSGENNRIYNFFRGLDNSFKPSYALSEDLGETWTTGSVVIRVPSTQRHRPYVVYASNGRDTIHLLYTEAHPRDFDNSLYHVYYKSGLLHQSDGRPIRALKAGLDSPDEGTLIFKGDQNQVAWCADIALDAKQRPVAVYSVQVGSAGLPPRQGGEDLRYRYARWDGKAWQDHPLAFAGTRLYAGEDDYSGLVAIDPYDPSIVYISTNADPLTGSPLISAADGKRHYEIYRGITKDGGATWAWTPITQNSTQDNLRPIRPRSDSRHRALIWLRGTYRSYTDYQQEIVGLFWK